MKIALIHTTVNSMQPIIEAFNKVDSSVEIMNFLDEGLMYDIKKEKEVSTKMLERITSMAKKAEKSGAEGVLLACSAFSPYVDELKKSLSIPMLSADMAMLEKVIDLGGKIGVLTTLEAAKVTTLGLMEKISKEKKVNLEVDGQVIERAFDELKQGYQGIHDELIKEKVEKLLETHERVVLAQMSMSRAIKGMNIDETRVFVSPELSARKIIEEVAKG